MNQVASFIYCCAKLCFLFDSHWFLAWLILRPWRWRRHFHLKCRLTFSGLHGVIYQKIELLTSAEPPISTFHSKWMPWMNSPRSSVLLTALKRIACQREYTPNIRNVWFPENLTLFSNKLYAEIYRKVQLEIGKRIRFIYILIYYFRSRSVALFFFSIVGSLSGLQFMYFFLHVQRSPSYRALILRVLLVVLKQQLHMAEQWLHRIISLRLMLYMSNVNILTPWYRMFLQGSYLANQQISVGCV
jgi:hypothetical protein